MSDDGDFMRRRVAQRREGIIAELVQIMNDQAHWNRIHPTEEPIDALAGIEADGVPVSWVAEARRRFASQPKGGA